MKNIKRNSINKRLKVIKMAEKLTNISEACRKLRVSRTQFYDYKKRFAQEGPKGLLIRPPVHKSYPFSIPDDNKDKIINYALGHPKYGCHRLSKALKGAGVGVSGATIQKILKKQNLETSRKRITEIENNFTKHRTDLSKEQADIIEARNPCFRERDNASSVPGELLCHDLFYLRDLKGNVRIYIQILLETYGGFVIALAHEYHHPTFLGEFLNRHVVPQYRDWGINIKAILTDQNDGFYSEKRNNYQSHLGLFEINHIIKSDKCWMENCFLKNFHSAFYKDFLREARNHLYFKNMKRFNKKLNEWIYRYNYEATQLGYRNLGRTPYAMLREHIDSDNNTLINKYDRKLLQIKALHRLLFGRLR